MCTHIGTPSLLWCKYASSRNLHFYLQISEGTFTFTFRNLKVPSEIWRYLHFHLQISESQTEVSQKGTFTSNMTHWGTQDGLCGSSGQVYVRWDIEGHWKDYLARAVKYIWNGMLSEIVLESITFKSKIIRATTWFATAMLIPQMKGSSNLGTHLSDY